MKKVLLNGTAIAGLALAFSATPAAAELRLGLSGHYSAYGIFANQDDGVGQPAVDTRRHDLQREGEIVFSGETTLDNGLTVGVEVQLAAQTNGNNSSAAGEGDTIDESYLYFSGNWGRVNVGSENGAAYLLQVGAPAVDANFDGIDPQYIIPARGGNAALAANGRGFNYGMGMGGDLDRGDTEKLTYLSPVFSGFQVGLSYSPDMAEDKGTRAGMPGNNTASALEQEYQVAGRWAGDFDGVGILVGAGYARAGQQNAVAGTDESRRQWNVGAQVNTAGFTLGGAYFRDNNALVGANDTRTWTAGATYDVGAYQVGASYLKSKTELGTGAGEDDVARILVGGSYTYGPGMTFNGAVHFYDLDAQSNAAADENSATVLTLGTTVRF